MEQTLITLKNLNGELTLAEELRQRGISFPAPCGGRGTCGKCRIQANGESVLACQTKLTGDVTVSSAAVKEAHGKVAAVDLGSTNVVVLLDGERIIKEPNVLQSYGADVISRLEHAKAGQFDSMHAQLRNQISRLTKGVEKIYIAGNTIMECFYEGIDPTPIATPPFASKELFLSSPTLAPCVSGYVGGDIVAGLVASRAYQREDLILFLDIGTNGELAIGNKDGFVTCACAAGPAFEYGASGRKGSETVDELARLVREGLVGKSGRLNGESFLSQKDIQSLILAKAAIRAAIEIARKTHPIETIVLAGEFGKQLNLESAFTIGLLPRVNHIEQIGNASLSGAQLALEEGPELLRNVQKMCTYEELSTNQEFQKLFIRYLTF